MGLFFYHNKNNLRLKVKDLLHAVGKKCGVEPGVIDALDLENVVERTIALQVGKVYLKCFGELTVI